MSTKKKSAFSEAIDAVTAKIVPISTVNSTDSGVISVSSDSHGWGTTIAVYGVQSYESVLYGCTPADPPQPWTQPIHPYKWYGKYVPQEGWLCPRCGKVNSPKEKQCTCKGGKEDHNATRQALREACEILVAILSASMGNLGQTIAKFKLPELTGGNKSDILFEYFLKLFVKEKDSSKKKK